MSTIRRRIAGAVLAASVLGSGLALAAAPEATAKPIPIGGCELTSARPVLHLGSKGTAVKQAQCLLNKAGGNVVVDGSFGYRTRATVRAFQARDHLEVDGYIGPRTWAQLYRYNTSS
ncbi:peptidoglycan-binding domain-containing protein [Microlunatus soli]|uniref:Putative peptidoglycan binding domain-containing protein n=1 Tax=Microlunatus soli TaxID=630515 RepID=A0A1H1UZE0_9ACTN|nr:peptidoglycan-binding domain-containing protein [Microlunatus soli]SDS77631.1 Putative peptidoglycan binding domain-containing protein [Microlunatus soli]